MKNIKLIKEPKVKETKDENTKVWDKKPFFIGFSAVFALLLLSLFGFMGYKVHGLQKQISAQNAQIEESRKVYVYSLDDVLKGANVIEIKRKFEGEIIKLNDEVFDAEKKIKSLKDAKVKEDFSTMYLNNVKMKRDELLANYDKTIKELTTKVNKAVGEIAKEKNVSVIFIKNAIAVKTPYIVDVTDEVIKKMKEY